MSLDALYGVARCAGGFAAAQRGESPASKYAMVPSTWGRGMLAP
jgi:hypothetical protein